MIERWGTPPEVIDVPLANNSIDLGRLDRFLRSVRAPAGAMLLPQLDGFLTGIAVGPELVMPSEWMPMVWGEEDPVFDSFEEMQTVFGIILRRYDEIVSMLRQDPPGFEPVFGNAESGQWIVTSWAEGFMEAMALCGPAWMPMIRRNEGKLLLLPIILSLPEDDVPELEGLELLRDPEMLAKVAEFIPDAVVEIDLFWQRQRARRQKTPRNSRCPCGPGRKYKNCCGK
jgi:uncharacterized protein